MSRYRIKVPEIEAFQLTIDQLNYIEKYGDFLDPPDWLENAVKEELIVINKENRIFLDRSKYGADGMIEIFPYDYIVNFPYDYIIKIKCGEILACRRKDFDNTFEEVK